MIFLNALRGVKAVVTMAKTGQWHVDVDVDLELVPIMPTGPALLNIGVNALRGTIDDKASGRFGVVGKVRLVGAPGWSKPIPALQIHNDATVISTTLYAAVAATVGEPPVVELGTPSLLSLADFAIMRGAASKIFAGVDWWVDILGITHVGPRIPLPIPPIADLLTWDPINSVAVFASDVLIVPGMTFTDPIRFDGVATVDDVEMTFDDAGGRAIAWCSLPSLVGAATGVLLKTPPPVAGSKLVQAIAALSRQATAVDVLKQYEYRCVIQLPDGRLNLQLTDPTAAAPLFLKFISPWGGIPGLTVKLAPTTKVLVAFINGDPGRPIVVGFNPASPPALEINLEAIHFAIGEGTSPVMKLSPAFALWLASVGTATGAGAPPIDMASLVTFTD